jgi:heme exporter protein B
MTPYHNISAIVTLVAKDLKAEFRLRRAWPAMLLLGLNMVLLMEVQIELPAQDKQRVVCSMLWLNVFCAGTMALERSIADEREEGCWLALMLYPIPPTVVYFAKMLSNFVSLLLLECLLILAFVIFSDVPLLDHPLQMLLVVTLANVGFVASGVPVSSASAGVSQRAHLLLLMQLPLVTPVILGAAEATRLLVFGDIGEHFWRWIQLLAAFAFLFTIIGTFVFGFVFED